MADVDIVCELDDPAFTDGIFASGAAVATTKARHRHAIEREIFDKDTTITTTNVLFYVPSGFTSVDFRNLSAAISVAATGSDRTVSVDLQEVTAGGGSSQTQSQVVFTNNSPVRKVFLGTFTNRVVDMTKFYRLQVTAAGSAGAQAKGLVVQLLVDGKT